MRFLKRPLVDFSPVLPLLLDVGTLATDFSNWVIITALAALVSLLRTSLIPVS